MRSNRGGALFPTYIYQFLTPLVSFCRLPLCTVPPRCTKLRRALLNWRRGCVKVAVARSFVQTALHLQYAHPSVSNHPRLLSVGYRCVPPRPARVNLLNLTLSGWRAPSYPPCLFPRVPLRAAPPRWAQLHRALLNWRRGCVKVAVARSFVQTALHLQYARSLCAWRLRARRRRGVSALTQRAVLQWLYRRLSLSLVEWRMSAARLSGSRQWLQWAKAAGGVGMHLYLYLYLSLCKYIYMCVCVCVCLYIYIYIYI